jgi:beta-glucanase (GH16 family)
VLAGSASAITDAAGNRWTISTTHTVLENAKAAGFTANVAEIAYVNGTLWQENTAKSWYSWTGSAWTAGADPLPTTTPVPTPPPTPSPNDTFVLAGSASAITDAAGNRWTISTTHTVLENAKAAAFTANVAEIAYANGTVWHENAAGNWYSWTGSAWSSGSDPLPVSGGPPGAANGAGSAANLSGYHLTFDWEANNFPNNPTPTNGAFATTLSSGLRYLGNGDQEYWADTSTGQSPFTLGNGVLDINAKYVGAGNTPGGGSLSYDSGVFTTQGWFSQQYGYFEMRAELPAGPGMWPAFWLLDNNSNQPGGWPPELDALEAFGAPNANGEGGTNQAHWDVHSQNTSQQAGAWVTLAGNAATSFHTYGVLWTPKTMSFVYDGTVVAQAPTPSDYSQEMYMIVNLAVGGTWPGNATGENGTMKIDYLRAFSSDSAIPAVALQTISSPDGGGTSLYGASSLTSGGASSTLAASQVSTPAILSQH